MRLELTGRHVDITPALRRLIDSKLAKLERLLNDRALSAQTVLTRERGRNRVDITLHARGEQFLHGFGFAATWELALGGAITKIAQQAQKVKGKFEARKRRTIRTLTAGDAPEAAAVKKVSADPAGGGTGKGARPRMPRVIRTDSQPIKAFNWCMRYLWAGKPLPEPARIFHMGRCGRCGRALTVPSSIESGLGPECAAKMEG